MGYLRANKTFGIIINEKQQAEKQQAEKQQAEKFAKDEIRSIVREDVQKIIQHDKDKKDPFSNNLDELYKSLGI